MKSLLCLLLLCATVEARDFHRATEVKVESVEPAAAPAETITKADIIATLKHQAQLVEELKAEKDAAVQDNIQLVAQVDAGTAKIQNIEKEQADLRQWGIDQQTRADKEAKESARRGNFIGFLGAAVAFFAAWKLVGGFTLAPALQYGALIGAPILGYTLARTLI